MGVTGDRRTRVAILGGGPAALTTAWELTNPAQSNAFEVTIYQLGWRLGGKCANGRDRQSHCEVQEHGLHVFFGYYDNAFELLGQVYDELTSSGEPQKYATVYDALIPSHSVTLMEEVNGQWKPWNLSIPAMPGLPGRVHHGGLWSVMVGALEMINHNVAVLLGRESSAAHSGMGRVGSVAKSFASALINHAASTHSKAHHSTLVRLIEAAWHDVQRLFHVGGFPSWWKTLDLDARRAFVLFDLVRAVAIGALREGFLVHPERATATMNELDFRAWLKKQGAFDVTIESAPVRALYDLTFAYPHGSTSSRGDLGAGSTVAGLFHMANYHGAFLWKMRAGTGDIVAAPLYKALCRRGVKFEFFARVTGLTPSLMRDEIESVTISRQVRLKDGEYAPLFHCDGLDCWPATPDYDQIVEGEELRRRNIDLESNWTPWQDTGGEVVLQQRVDFDVVVLGIPVDGLRSICAQLIQQKPCWQSMMSNVKTVQTQSVQLRFGECGARLGSLPAGTVIGGNDSSPLDAAADISEVIDAECWGAVRPQYLSILSGVLPGPDTAPARTDTGYPAKMQDCVVASTREFLSAGAPTLWPTIANHDGFDWNALWAPGIAPGPARLQAQYLRANVDPDQRYTLSVAGSAAHRLRTDESEYYNLYLAGDWIDNPGNLGGFESSVMSGRLASRAVSGLPKTIARVPKDSRYYQMREPFISMRNAPMFVEYNGMQTFPGPFEFKSVASWAFFVRGDYAKLQALLDHLFNVTSSGAVSLVPLTDMLMMTFIDIADARSPFDPQASGAYEREVAFWIMAGRKDTPNSPSITSVAGFTPFLIINNPLGYLEGRDVWGYMKQVGHVSLPTDANSDGGFLVDAYGVREKPFESPWSYKRLLSIKPVGPASPEGAGRSFKGIAELLAAIRAGVGQDKPTVMPSLQLAENLFEDFVHRRMPQVFLKQFRDIRHPERACYQAITQANTRVSNPHGFELTQRYEMTIDDLFNTAISETLGIPAKVELPFGIHFTMDFTIENGEVLWQARTSDT